MAVSLAANALTTVAAISERISGYSNDRITRAINVASNNIENAFGRPLGYAEVTEANPEQHRGDGGTVLWLMRAPLVSVTSVLIFDNEDEEWSRSPAFDALGKIYRPSGWTAAPAIACDLTRGPDFSNLAYNIKVAYFGGFYLPAAEGSPPSGATRLPYEIEEACINEAIGSLGRVLNANITEETTPGGWRRKFGSSGGATSLLSGDTRQLIDRHPLKIRHV